MDLQSKRFGRGPRELGGAVDLINQYKLWPHYESFCRRSIPLSISETHYLHNVVGNTEIRKGDGMELDQLFQNASHVRKTDGDIRLFDLDVLGDAFRMREATSVSLPLVEQGTPTAVTKLKSELKEKEKKHKKLKSKDKTRKDHKKQKSQHKDKSSHKEKNRNFSSCSNLEDLKKQGEKKRRPDGFEDLPFHGNKRLVIERSGQQGYGRNLR